MAHIRITYRYASTILGLAGLACGQAPPPDDSPGGEGGGSGGLLQTGGQASGGGPLGIGGAPASGGATSGGAPTTGGISAGGANTGGLSTGGANAASGGSGAGSGGDSPSSGGSTSELTPPDCTTRSAVPGETNQKLTIGGQERKFIVHIPKQASDGVPLPLVIDFHALGGTGSQEKGSSGFSALAESEGFIVVWPDGIDNAWNVGPCCTNSRDVDDVGFARAMVETVSATACVDPRRVHATGFSMGGGMSHYLACHAADVFASVAPSAFDLLEENVDDCKPARPISVFAMRGTADTVVPFDGGKGGSGKVTFLGAQATLEFWANNGACSGEPTVDGGITMYSSCAPGIAVGLDTIQGGSHAPGPASLAWDFLKEHPYP
jgi:polyhydroxybutyrate depolymerase